MKKRFTAILTASLMLSATAAALPPAITVSSVDTTSDSNLLPEWIPQSFNDALEFRNTYGTTHIEDGFICLVLNEEHQTSDEDQPDGVLRYEITVPKGPAQLVKRDLYTKENAMSEYEVVVYKPLKQADFSVSITDTFVTDRKPIQYSFSVDEDLNTTETDIYGWLPDSEYEFDRFSETGGVVVHGNYLAICMESNAGTPYRWSKTKGGNCFSKPVIYDCSPETAEAISGGKLKRIALFQAAKDGEDTIEYALASQMADRSVEKTLTADCVVLGDAQYILLPNEVRVSLADMETGELIPLKEAVSLWTDISYITPTGSVSTGPIYMITENPIVLQDLAKFSDADSFSFGLSQWTLPEGCYLPTDSTGGQPGYLNGSSVPENHVTATKYDNNSMDVVFRLIHRTPGDVNGDGAFDKKDVLLVQKWLLADPDADLANWEAADLYIDGKLTANDLTLMKQMLCANQMTIVQPDYPATQRTEIFVIGDTPYLYTGPGLHYPIIRETAREEIFREAGYNEGDDGWIYVRSGEEYGWIKVYNQNDDQLNIVVNTNLLEKPVIYLYPETETDVHVELDLIGGELATTYPKYQNGWDVTASPDGTLLNKADGSHHRSLFWDAKVTGIRFDVSRGFCVAGSDTERFLKETLTYMGLTESEMNEFIVYWLPRMEQNPYNLITFQDDAYTNAAKLNITPTPDSILRIFMTFCPLEEAVDIAPQQLASFERKGFTAVEWGGSELPS